MSNETVMIQRDEKFQPNGIWVFSDADAVANVAAMYAEKYLDMSGDDIDNYVAEFISATEEMPMCDAARDALAENGRDGYLGECPHEWK